MVESVDTFLGSVGQCQWGSGVAQYQYTHNPLCGLQIQPFTFRSEHWVLGDKMYDLIKSMYLENRCAVKIGDKQIEYFTQRRGVHQGCTLSPTLFNMYIN